MFHKCVACVRQCCVVIAFGVFDRCAAVEGSLCLARSASHRCVFIMHFSIHNLYSSCLSYIISYICTYMVVLLFDRTDL
jgi:hypothetical protein